MIDFEKEEFLQRLDIRLGAMAAMLAYHEKHIVSSLCINASEYKQAEKHIDKTQQALTEYIAKTDREIRENFERIKKEIEGAEVKHGSWIVTDADDGMCEEYAGFIEFKCSECGLSVGIENGQYGWYYGDPIPWKCCPICGAKMDGERREK